MMRWIAAFVLAVMATPAIADDHGEAEKPLNILWIIAEDMGPDQGHYGEPGVHTPNMDALAARSMVFDNAFATAPICSISRSAFLTGMHSISIGAHQHRTPVERKKPLPEGVRLLTHRLEDAGYATALVRNLAPAGEESAIEGSGKTDWNFIPDRQAYQLNDFNLLAGSQPFFAQVQFKETHRGGDWDAARNMVPTPANRDEARVPPYYPQTDIARDSWTTYLDNIALFDLKVGYVLQRLEEEGLAHNTIIILFADHGRAMPRAKQFLWDSGLAVPLIVHWPAGHTPPEGYRVGREDALVSLIDVTAQTLAFAGVEAPLLMQGHPFLGAQGRYPAMVFGARDRADETFLPMRTVRDRRYRYIRNIMPERPWGLENRYKERSYPILREMFRMKRDGTLGDLPGDFMADARPSEELYDTLADPFNVNNLADDPAYGAVLLRLSGALDAWLEASGDQGRVLEPAEIADGIAADADERFAEDVEAVIAAEGPWR